MYTLKEIEKAILEETPPEAMISKVEAEGPVVVIYSKNTGYFLNNDQIMRRLVTLVRRRIIVRSDPVNLSDPGTALKTISEMIPADAGVSHIDFMKEFAEVNIHAKKIGLVIGKGGGTLRDIVMKTGWTPKVLREPAFPCSTIETLRKTMLNDESEIKRIMKSIGRRIFQEKKNSTDNWVRLSALGGFREVGRSCLFLQTPNSAALLDCGLNVESESNAYPYLDAINLAIDSLDSVIISHSHLDHMGFTPYLFAYGYDGPVYCTKPTKDVMALLLFDAMEIAESSGRPLPYTGKDIKKMLHHTIPLDYSEVTDISPDMRLTLHNAGHILGSAITHLHIGDGLFNLVYTGDIKFGETRLLNPASTRFPRCEVLIMESTYGGPNDIMAPRRAAEVDLIQKIRAVTDRGGKAIIPVFAVGRAQEVMMTLEAAYRRGELNVPVYVDGMIMEVTSITTTYLEYMKNYIKNMIFRGHNPFISETFVRVDKQDQRKGIIESKDPCVILSTSGMMSGGPVVNYFNELASDEKNGLIFIGYQAVGTMGRKIQSGQREFPIATEDGKRRALSVKLEASTAEGFSGHSDRRQLLGYIKNVTPRPQKILHLHGEPSKCMNMAQTTKKLFNIDAQAPQNLDTIRLR